MPGYLEPVSLDMNWVERWKKLKNPERLTHRFGAVLKRLGLCRMAYHLRSSLLWMTVL